MDVLGEVDNAPRDALDELTDAARRGWRFRHAHKTRGLIVAERETFALYHPSSPTGLRQLAGHIRSIERDRARPKRESAKRPATTVAVQ